MTELPIDIDQFEVDLDGFFKLSSARREEFSSMEELIDITSKYLLHHSSVRRPKLKYILVRIIEHHGKIWKNISSVSYRSSHLRCSIIKGVFRNFAKFTGKRLCQSLFFNKVVGSTDNNQSNHVIIDDFWKDFESMMNDDGNLKFPRLFGKSSVIPKLWERCPWERTFFE